MSSPYKPGSITGVTLADGELFSASAVAIGSGTLLNGLGYYKTPHIGRTSEYPANGLAAAFRLGFTMGHSDQQIA